MNCPVCDRYLAPTLSICTTCGTMMNDSVREELQTKVAPISGPLRPDVKPPLKVEAPPVPQPPALERPATVAPPKRVQTDGLRAPKTNPTLVGFQNKNAPLPDWRLQMQNAVRQRRGEAGDANQTATPKPVERQVVAARAASRVEKQRAVEPPDLENADPRLTAALKRISESRNANMTRSAPKRSAARPQATARPEPLNAQKSFPFNVVSATPNPPVRPYQPNPAVESRPKPAMVMPLRMEKKLDTNKLPLLETVVSPQTPDEPRPANNGNGPDAEIRLATSSPAEFSEVRRIVINAENEPTEPDDIDLFDDEIEDLAPFGMRFNAGFFDLIIGVFVSMVLLLPFVLAGGNWFTLAGLLTFAGTCAIVLFLYMTASIGFFGKTLGMRLFSLELVDAEENEHPTIHQAAVNSSLFLLSLVFGGAGFLTVFFNEEKRAVHDLLSGTIIVREF